MVTREPAHINGRRVRLTTTGVVRAPSSIAVAYQADQPLVMGNLCSDAVDPYVRDPSIVELVALVR